MRYKRARPLLLMQVSQARRRPRARAVLPPECARPGGGPSTQRTAGCGARNGGLEARGRGRPGPGPELWGRQPYLGPDTGPSPEPWRLPPASA